MNGSISQSAFLLGIFRKGRPYLQRIETPRTAQVVDRFDHSGRYKLRKSAEKWCDSKVVAATLAIPENLTQRQRQAWLAAAAIADLPVLSLVTIEGTRLRERMNYVFLKMNNFCNYNSYFMLFRKILEMVLKIWPTCCKVQYIFTFSLKCREIATKFI